MEQKISDKLLNRFISSLDWKTIVSLHIASRSVLTSSSEMKAELKESLLFLIASDIKELRTRYWILSNKMIAGTNGKKVRKLEAHYIASAASAQISSDNSTYEQEIPEMLSELMVLKSMLEKAIMKEEYELCAMIRNRIKRLSDSIGRKP